MMKKQLLGFALILFGILLNMVEANGGIWLPILDCPPLHIIGLLAGIIGIGILIHDVRKDAKENQQKSEET